MKLSQLFELSPYIEVGVRNIYWGSPILPRAATALSRWRSQHSKQEGRRPPATSMDKIIELMRRWGIGPGDLLIAHSGYRGIRGGGESPDDVIDALLDLLGPEGTLAMPAIPYYPDAPVLYERLVADMSDVVFDYDPALTPAWTGAVPNAMLKRPEARRSLHPLNTLVAIGPLSRGMMEGNIDGDRPFPCGPTSSWKFCYDHGAKVVAMGADMAHSFTLIHTAEDMLGEDWPIPGWYRERKYRIKIDGEFEPRVVRERKPKWAKFYAERTISRDIHESGICARHEIDGVNVQLLDGREIIEYLNRRNHTAYPYYVPRRYFRRSSRSAPAGRQLKAVATLVGYRALWTDGDRAVLSRGRALYLLDLDTFSVRRFATLPSPKRISGRLALPARLLRRVARAEVAAAIPIDRDRFLVAAADGTFIVSADTGETHLSRMNQDGFRALRFTDIRGIAGFRDGVYFGDYGNNPDKRPVSIWGLLDHRWQEVYRFADGEVNHIHALVPDLNRGCVWLLTGDYGEAAAVWRAVDGFDDMERVCSGQRARAAWAFPMEQGLLYGTDSHLQPNNIVLLEQTPAGWTPRSLHPLSGSCLFAARFGDRYVFTTAVEPGPASGNLALDLLDPKPGPGIVDSGCEVVVGDPERGFRRELFWPADLYPKRLFGFSTIRLPEGQSSRRLLLSGEGVRGHDNRVEVYTPHP